MPNEEIKPDRYYYAKHADEVRIVYVDGPAPFCRITDCREMYAVCDKYEFLGAVPVWEDSELLAPTHISI